MDFKKYRTKKENRINESFTIPANSIVEIDWNGMDGAYWQYEGHVGCPWIDSDVEEVMLDEHETVGEQK